MVEFLSSEYCCFRTLGNGTTFGYKCVKSGFHRCATPTRACYGKITDLNEVTTCPKPKKCPKSAPIKCKVENSSFEIIIGLLGTLSSISFLCNCGCCLWIDMMDQIEDKR